MDVFIVNYEIFDCYFFWLVLIGLCGMVVDEVYFIKNFFL